MVWNSFACYDIVLHCIVLQCLGLHRIVMYCSALYCMVWYGIVFCVLCVMCVDHVSCASSVYHASCAQVLCVTLCCDIRPCMFTLLPVVALNGHGGRARATGPLGVCVDLLRSTQRNVHRNPVNL